MGQLVGHRQDGQRSVLLRPKRLIDTTAVHETLLPALYEDLAQKLLVILTVHVEGLREETDNQKFVNSKRKGESVDTFKKQLNTHLFRLAFVYFFYLFIFISILWLFHTSLVYVCCSAPERCYINKLCAQRKKMKDGRT